jgi:hypothetical protein
MKACLLHLCLLHGWNLSCCSFLATIVGNESAMSWYVLPTSLLLMSSMLLQHWLIDPFVCLPLPKSLIQRRASELDESGEESEIQESWEWLRIQNLLCVCLQRMICKCSLRTDKAICENIAIFFFCFFLQRPWLYRICDPGFLIPFLEISSNKSRRLRLVRVKHTWPTARRSLQDPDTRVPLSAERSPRPTKEQGSTGRAI